MFYIEMHNKLLTLIVWIFLSLFYLYTTMNTHHWLLDTYNLGLENAHMHLLYLHNILIIQIVYIYQKTIVGSVIQHTKEKYLLLHVIMVRIILISNTTYFISLYSWTFHKVLLPMWMENKNKNEESPLEKCAKQ